jgi:endonuclease YncB( thermonuclease family)
LTRTIGRKGDGCRVQIPQALEPVVWSRRFVDRRTPTSTLSPSFAVPFLVMNAPPGLEFGAGKDTIDVRLHGIDAPERASRGA